MVEEVVQKEVKATAKVVAPIAKTVAPMNSVLEKRVIKKRNIFLVYLFHIITLGIYGVYWMISTKRDMNSLGATIPNAFLMVIPIVNLYWFYKYSEGYSIVKKDDHKVLWFFLFLIFGIVMPAMVQSELNKVATPVVAA
jgi:hypothetical protein